MMHGIPEEIFEDLARRFGYAPYLLTQFGGGREDSNGLVFRVDTPEGPRVLKIVEGMAQDPSALTRVRVRANFFSFLSERGLDVVTPIRDEAGHLIETSIQGDTCYIAYTYPYMYGVHPQPNNWNNEIILAWGRALGRMHRLAGEYPIWDGTPSAQSGELVLSWREEVDYFLFLCKEEDVRAYWQSLKERLYALPCTRETCGFVHNDAYMQNVLVDNGAIRLLDFDMATCHFFACDIAAALRTILQTTAGGFDRPLENEAALDWFAGKFLEGYAQEHILPREALDTLEFFLCYRRAFQYTIMQDWLAENPRFREPWKQLMREEPPLLTRVLARG